MFGSGPDVEASSIGGIRRHTALPRKHTGVQDFARSGDLRRREELYELARMAYADPEPAMRTAAGIRFLAFGPRITYSRKVFIPLT
jgi:hypothetical protein